MIKQATVVSCAQCGTTADELPMDWVTSVDHGRTQHFCPRCARDNLRAIEARLDPEWW